MKKKMVLWCSTFLMLLSFLSIICSHSMATTILFDDSDAFFNAANIVYTETFENWSINEGLVPLTFNGIVFDSDHHGHWRVSPMTSFIFPGIPTIYGRALYSTSVAEDFFSIENGHVYDFGFNFCTPTHDETIGNTINIEVTEVDGGICPSKKVKPPGVVYMHRVPTTKFYLEFVMRVQKKAGP